jgi:hypothetical protein
MDINCIVSWAKGNPSPEDIEKLAEDLAKLPALQRNPLKKLSGSFLGKIPRKKYADREERGKRGAKAFLEYHERRRQEKLLQKNGITVAVRDANEGREQ